MQENAFFREQPVKTKLLDILFIYVKLNPDLGYRQGMHEILAPILWVVNQDAIDKSLLEGAGESEITEEDSLMLQCLDASYVEHDSFMLFCFVMQTARSYYEYDDHGLGNGNFDVIPIVSRCEHIFHDLLASTDQALFEHLEAVDVLPQIFLT